MDQSDPPEHSDQFTAVLDAGNELRTNETHEPTVQFVTFVHELGHLYLVPLGPDKHPKIGSRPSLKHAQQELETESLAWLVSHRHGIESKSQTYLAEYVRPDTSFASLDVYNLLKAAGQVESALDIAAHTLFEPKPEGTDDRISEPAG